jgi:plasmid stabilization system protein ParE
MIPSKIDLHPVAVKEARAAYHWYLRRSAMAAARFRAAFEAALKQIARTPNRWPIYLYGTRYRHLRRFPFVLVYRLRVDRLRVVAVAHTGRRPGYWKKRKFK